MPPKIPMPDPTPGQEKFLFELSRMIPESFWITMFDKRIQVGAMVRGFGKVGWIRLLFIDHRKNPPMPIGLVIAWEDGSITVPPAVLDFLAS